MSVIPITNRDAYTSTSRYKGAAYYQIDVASVGLRIEPSTWCPPEIAESVTDLHVKVSPGEVGRLDLVSHRVYGIDSLWWILAYANDIVDPFEEVVSDLDLRYPPFDWVAANVLV